MVIASCLCSPAEWRPRSDVYKRADEAVFSPGNPGPEHGTTRPVEAGVCPKCESGVGVGDGGAFIVNVAPRAALDASGGRWSLNCASDGIVGRGLAWNEACRGGASGCLWSLNCARDRDVGRGVACSETCRGGVSGCLRSLNGASDKSVGEEVPCSKVCRGGGGAVRTVGGDCFLGRPMDLLPGALKSSMIIRLVIVNDSLMPVPARNTN